MKSIFQIPYRQRKPDLDLLRIILREITRGLPCRLRRRYLTYRVCFPVDASQLVIYVGLDDGFIVILTGIHMEPMCTSLRLPRSALEGPCPRFDIRDPESLTRLRSQLDYLLGACREDNV